MSFIEIKPYIGTPYGVEYISDTTLDGCTGPEILYEKPDGLTGLTAATIDEDSFIIEIPASINDTSGIWRFHPRAYYYGDSSISEWDAFSVYVRETFK